MGVVINTLYALLVAIMVTIAAYVIVAKLRGVELNIIHIGALGCIFIFMGIQSYLFFNAWDEKEALNEQTDALNSIIAVASGYLDEAGLSDDAKELAKQYRPVLNLFGINLDNSDDSVTVSTDALNSYYTKYMWKRVGWMLAVVALYIMASFFLTPPKKKKRFHSYSDMYDMYDY